MRRWYARGAIVCALVAGCAAPPREQVRTMKAMEEQTVAVVYDPKGSDKREALQAYRAFLEVAPDDARRMHAMRRIADLQLAISEEGVPDVATAARGAGANGFATAARLYRELLQTYPDYPDVDGVLYQLARAYDDVGDSEQALRNLTRLTKEYPDSPLWVEAQFRRGEMLFVQRRYGEADQAYQAVIRVGGRDSTFYEQALYKHGWSLFKQRQFEPALDAFMAVLDGQLAYSGQSAEFVTLGALSRTEREVVEDTLRVVSLIFSYQDGPRTATAYFSRHPGHSYEHLVFEGLGQLYIDKERYTDAANTFNTFVERHPGHALAPRFSIRAYEVYESAGFRDLAFQGKQDFLKRYGPRSPFWKTHEISGMPVVAQHLAEEMILMAQYYHAAAQKTHQSADYRTAAQWYRDYLSFFPQDARAPELKFLLAELLFEDKQYLEAIEYYEQAAYGEPAYAKPAEAGYAALLAYKRYIKQLTEDADRRVWRTRAVDSALRFAERFPAHPQAVPVLTQAAEELFAMGEAPRAMDIATRVIKYVPPAPAAERRTAWTVIGHVNFDNGNYAQAETAYQRALLLYAPDDKARTPILERLAASIYKQGEAAREQGDLAGAAALFLRVPQLAAGASIVATAQYDAAAAFIAAQRWDSAIAVLEPFRREHPDSRWQEDVTRKLAVAYQQSGRLSQAAAEYQRLGQGGDETVARDALWQAAELFDQGKQPQQSMNAYQRYLSRFPQPFDRAMEARRRLADTAGALGDASRRRYWLQEIVDADAKAGAQRTDFSHTLAAQAALELAGSLREEYARQTLVIPLDQSLKVKKAAMQKALDAYGKAAEFGIAAVTTAATYHIGDLYFDFSRALLDSQRPRELSSEELEQYDTLLEEQAYPFEEEAIKLHEVNYRRVKEGTYDEWVKASIAQLGELLPVRYGKHERMVPLVESIQ